MIFFNLTVFHCSKHTNLFWYCCVLSIVFNDLSYWPAFKPISVPRIFHRNHSCWRLWRGGAYTTCSCTAGPRICRTWSKHRHFYIQDKPFCSGIKIQLDMIFQNLSVISIKKDRVRISDSLYIQSFWHTCITNEIQQ